LESETAPPPSHVFRHEVQRGLWNSRMLFVPFKRGIGEILEVEEEEKKTVSNLIFLMYHN